MMDDAFTPEQQQEMKRLQRRIELEDHQRTLSDASDFLNAGFVQAQAKRQQEATPRERTAPLVTVQETVLPIIRTVQQVNESTPDTPPPPLAVTYVTALICNADGDVVSVDLMTRPT